MRLRCGDLERYRWNELRAVDRAAARLEPASPVAHYGLEMPRARGAAREAGR